MNILRTIERFPTHGACLAHLEKLRFGEGHYCPLCGSVDVARKSEKGREGRWNCYDCKASFNVLSGTLFEKTRISLHKWFLAIAIMANAKKSVSSHQLARDLELNQKTAWFMQQRIRAEMARAESTMILRGIVEADETYVGGKPRKTNDGKSKEPSKRGRGTKKTPVIGAVERGGRVVARVASDLSAKGVLSFVAGVVDPKGTHLITDELPVYTQTHKYYKHLVIKHVRRFVEGHVHTNSIESFWALVKRAWYGTHHRYTKKYMPLFLAESCWKYNHRNYERPFEAFMGGVVRGL